MDIPQVVIPATPEIIMTGIKQQVTPRVMECSRGGYILIFDGHGICAKSSWSEVIQAIEDFGHDVLGVERESTIPDGIRPNGQQEATASHSHTTFHNFVVLLSAAFATAALLFSIRTA